MANWTPYMANTRGIAVSVEPTYLETKSSPDRSEYFWTYRVIIENQGRETVQLLSRHWMISNARGELNEVKGPGVVGEQPVIEPGESYEYTSGAPLNTPSGMMGGAYQMESESGERFDIEIPTFSLDRPNQRERRYLNIKTLTALTLHLVGSAHHPRRRVERRATRVFKALSRLEDRLLPDNTWSLDLVQFATRIRDHPVPAQPMHRFPSLIRDDHSISPKILRAVRR